MARRQGPFTCSFCGKRREQTRRVIAGPHGVYICEECIGLCNQILAEGPQDSCPRAREEVGALRSPRPPAWRRLLHGWHVGAWHLTLSRA
jgi:ATP-dependent Clp protease ATP-binding subunit ClpX